MLTLEIEYLFGVAFAAIGPDSTMPDWPPQPDRVFSALVATWAARGEEEDERVALEWLEKLPPPRIHAGEAAPRTPATVFVPPNDPTSARAKHAAGVLPEFRGRQPRRFPAGRLRSPTLRMVWPGGDPESSVLRSLQRLARDTAYVGHSASLTRCWFTVRPPDENRAADAARARRRVYPGRLRELRLDFERGLRPGPGALVDEEPTGSSVPGTSFSPRGWLLLENVGESVPDLRACAFVAKAIRDTVLSGYARTGRADSIPEAVSGHRADGTPTRAPHLAVVPLPFVGYPYADGHVMGFALVPPENAPLLDDEDFLGALRSVALLDDESGRRLMQVTSSGGTSSRNLFSVTFSLTLESPRRSLDPGLYTRASRTFATVTPVVLDRHLKKKGAARDGEIAGQVADACRNIGLPAPELVVPDKHSSFEGAPSAYPSSGSPAWAAWQRPRSLASRQLTHAMIRFSEPVAGPVLLGAGRYVGFGLCRPIRRGPQ